MRKGDIGRLNYILNTLRSGKPLFPSDQKYLEKLLNQTQNVQIENDLNKPQSQMPSIDDTETFSRSKNQNNISRNRKRNIAIGIGVAGAIVFAVAILLLNTGNLSIPNNPLISQLDSLNPTKTYKINTDYELICFLIYGPVDSSTFSFMQSPEEFQKKYPEEAAKLKKLGEDPKFVDQLVNAQRSVDDPFDKIIYPYEMREVLSSILIKEFSINPQLKNQLTILLGIKITPEMCVGKQ